MSQPQYVLREDGKRWSNAVLVSEGLYGTAEDDNGERVLIALTRNEHGVYFEVLATLGKWGHDTTDIAIEIAKAVERGRILESEASIHAVWRLWHEHRFPIHREGTIAQRDAASLAFVRSYLGAV